MRGFPSEVFLYEARGVNDSKFTSGFFVLTVAILLSPMMTALLLQERKNMKGTNTNILFIRVFFICFLLRSVEYSNRIIDYCTLYYIKKQKNENKSNSL